MFKKIQSKAIVAVALSLMLLLSACSTAPAKSNGASTSQDVSSVDNGTKTISTKLGDVEVPVNPQRIMVNYLQGDVLALGVQPSIVGFMQPGAVFESLMAEDTIILEDPRDREEVMAAEPDLIITANPDDFTEFEKIAPVVYIEYQAISLDERLLFIGDVIGKQAEAEQLLKDYHQTLDEAKQTLTENGLYDSTVSVVMGDGSGGMIVRGNNWGISSTVYGVLGLHAPKLVEDTMFKEDKTISMEVMHDYMGDYILYEPDNFDDILDSPIWATLDAVTTQQVATYDSTLAYFPDIYSVTKQVEAITSTLLNLSKS
ncbi:MAG: ABC transporter substrate-binding protein [Oscillospiraceae bacterium]